MKFDVIRNAKCEMRNEGGGFAANFYPLPLEGERPKGKGLAEKS